MVGYVAEAVPKYGTRVARAGVLAAFVFLVLLSRSSADLVMPKVGDPALHRQLKELSQSQHHVMMHRNDPAREKLQGLLSEGAPADQEGWARLHLAIALTGLEQYSSADTVFTSLIQSYSKSTPVLAAWAQFRQADAQAWAGNAPEAIRGYRKTEELLPVLEDLGPIFHARRKAAERYFGTSKFDPENPDLERILGVNLKDVDQQAWAYAVQANGFAASGNYEGAQYFLEKLQELLPAGDRRIAVATIDVALGEIESYHRRKAMEMLIHAQEATKWVAANYPGEVWMVSRSRLRMAQFQVENRVGLEDAERALLEIIASKEAPDLIPEASTYLAELERARQNWARAGEKALTAVNQHPYSTWNDYLLYLAADSFARDGNTNRAIAVLDRLINEYPESTWLVPAKMLKEDASK